jgi:hypothetical protein
MTAVLQPAADLHGAPTSRISKGRRSSSTIAPPRSGFAAAVVPQSGTLMPGVTSTAADSRAPRPRPPARARDVSIRVRRPRVAARERVWAMGSSGTGFWCP